MGEHTELVKALGTLKNLLMFQFDFLAMVTWPAAVLWDCS